MEKLHIIVTAFHRPDHLRLLMQCFILQSNPNWIMQVIHDGPAPEVLRERVASMHDPRITLEETPQVNGSYGFVNRKQGLEKLVADPLDFVLFTNDDNYYVPRFVEFIFDEAKPDVGMVYCDMVHSHYAFGLLPAQIKVNHIDMGAFCTRVDIAKETGFNHNVYEADGLFAEECAMKCAEKGMRAIYISKPLFVHC